MFTLQNEPQDKLQILAQGVALYWQTLRIAFPYSLAGALCLFAPLFLEIFPFFNMEDLEHPLGWISKLVLCWLGGFIFISALIFRLYCFSHNIPSNFWISLKQAGTKLASLLMLGVLYSLIILSSTMVLILPGIILALSLMFSFILIIIGNQNILQTLITSHRLVWGHWWHTALITAIPLLLSMTISLTCFVIVMGFLVYCHTSVPYLFLFAYITNVVIQTLLIPFIFSIVIVLLQDLRQRMVLLPRW